MTDNRAINILMRRDNLTESEAIAAIEECREIILADLDFADDVIMEMLGLEPDYIPDVMFS